jgi:hypothetical protein
MENKKYLLPFILVLTFVPLLPVAAQSVRSGQNPAPAPAESKNYFLKQTPDGKETLVQRLFWEQIDEILDYEVVIERKKTESDHDGPRFTEQFRTKTTDNFIEVSLPPGNYRYEIIVYNLLGKPETTSDWSYFDIIKAYQPELYNIVPKLIYLEEENTGKFSITGNNLFNDSRYSLRKRGKLIDTYTAQPADHEKNNRKADLQFDVKRLDVGIYDLIVTDPGGLSAAYGPIIIKFKKMTDFDVSAGYSVPVVLFDGTIKKYLDTNVFPLSMTARCSFLPFKRHFGYFGVGVEAVCSRMAAQYDTYRIDGNLVTGHLNLIYQLPVIKNHFVFELHAGGGITAFGDLAFHFEHNIDSDPLNALEPSAGIGAAFQFYIFKRLYIDVCADYLQALIPDMSFGMIVPALSVGWQF